PDPDPGVVAADLDRAELRVRKGPPDADDPALVVIAIPARHRQDLVPRPALVVVDERPVDGEAGLLPEVAELADHRRRAPLGVRVRREIAAERLVRLVGELLEAAHHRIAGDR